jgi:hypothetical protein
MTVTPERFKIGTFREFKDFTLAVARGERQVDPNEPKIWLEVPIGDTGSASRPPAAGVRLLSDGKGDRPG